MHSDVTSIRSVAHAGRPQRSLGKHKRKPLKSTSCGLIQQIPEMFEWFWCGLQTQKGRDVIETVGVHSIAWISVSLRSLTALGDATWRRNMNLSWCVRRGWVLSINMYRHVSTVSKFIKSAHTHKHRTRGISRICAYHIANIAIHETSQARMRLLGRCWSSWMRSW